MNGENYYMDRINRELGEKTSFFQDDYVKVIHRTTNQIRYVKLNAIEPPVNKNQGKGHDSILLEDYNPLGKLEPFGFVDTTGKASDTLFKKIKEDIQYGSESNVIKMHKQSLKKAQETKRVPIMRLNVNVNKDLLKHKLEKELNQIQDEFVEMEVKDMKDFRKFREKVKKLKNDPKRQYLISENKAFDKEQYFYEEKTNFKNSRDPHGFDIIRAHVTESSNRVNFAKANNPIRENADLNFSMKNYASLLPPQNQYEEGLYENFIAHSSEQRQVYKKQANCSYKDIHHPITDFIDKRNNLTLPVIHEKRKARSVAPDAKSNNSFSFKHNSESELSNRAGSPTLNKKFQKMLNSKMAKDNSNYYENITPRRNESSQRVQTEQYNQNIKSSNTLKERSYFLTENSKISTQDDSKQKLNNAHSNMNSNLSISNMKNNISKTENDERFSFSIKNSVNSQLRKSKSYSPRQFIDNNSNNIKLNNNLNVNVVDGKNDIVNFISGDVQTYLKNNKDELSQLLLGCMQYKYLNIQNDYNPPIKEEYKPQVDVIEVNKYLDQIKYDFDEKIKKDPSYYKNNFYKQFNQVNLKQIFNLPTLLEIYESKNGASSQESMSSVTMDDKFSMLLKYEDGNPELIPYKLYKRQMFMYNNNYLKFMKNSMGLQRDMLYPPKIETKKPDKLEIVKNKKDDSLNKEDITYFKPWLKRLDVYKYQKCVIRNKNTNKRSAESYFDWYRMREKMCEDLYMLMKLLQNTNSAEWVIKCLHLENYDAVLLSKQISASRLQLIESMQLQSKLYLNLLEMCVNLDPDIEMFYLVDYLRELLLNGFKLNFNHLNTLFDQLEEEQFGDSFVKAVKEIMYLWNWDWNIFTNYLKGRNIKLVGMLFSNDDE